MAIRSQRVLSSFLNGDARRADAGQTTTICITLAPRAGLAPSDKPPVRIFLGTEAAQFRAERAFVWSIERVRDPARRYEIYLMKDFAGFERRFWLTGFTNYRFAIPELAGGEGRAIYNDADQIYLHDPALLFDTPMDGHGVLSINDRDTSVMLIDCAKMIALWNGDTARATKNRELEARMRAVDGLWGAVDAGWNARDAEYAPGESHLIHYTTIHTQPWRPTPQDYVYRANPAHDIWMTIEREADEAGFQLFGDDHPSLDLARLRASDRTPRMPNPARVRDMRRLVADTRATSLLYFGYGEDDALKRLAGADRLAAANIETARPEATGVTARADVVAADSFEQLPDLDMPWLLDRLFACADRAVILCVELDRAADRSTPADALWWYAQMVAAGRRHPDRHWRLVVRRPRRARAAAVSRWSGGALLNRPPRVWALLHYKNGHRSQTLGVADALGWPYEEQPVLRAPLRYGATLVAERLGMATGRLPGGLSAPWPDVVVASGWLPAALAGLIAARNHQNSRLILLGRRGGRVGESQHIGIVCRHFDLPPNPREIPTVLPPCKVGARQLAEARRRWPDLYGESAEADAVGPRVALLVGGDSVQHRIDAATARDLGQRVRAQVADAGGRLAVLTSRRTGEAAGTALREAVGDEARFEAWMPRDEGDNPYLGYLAHADILVVTGESESMLAEAVATGKPVFIAPLPDRAPNARRRVADWVCRQADTDRFNARGSRRPQQGLQYLCARLMERRIFVPRRDMAGLHEALIERGVARALSDRLVAWQPPAWHETEWVAQRIRAMLPAAGARPTRAEAERREGDDAHRAASG